MARTRTDISSGAPDQQPDGELARRAALGDVEAFEELYRRHAATAFRVAHRVTGNAHDAADAVSDAFTRVLQALAAGRLEEDQRFRPYLLSSARNAAIDVIRRAGRATPTADGHEPAQTAATPAERMIDSVDSSLVAAAFRALPERWRSVLWLTEVEQLPPREAARLLGLTPNGAAQLAVRARAGLRERFLQAHVGEVGGGCRDTAERLGAYVGGALSPREIARVDQHLAACDACRAREAELRDLGTTLRKAALPVPIAIGGGGMLHKLAGRVADLVHGGADRLVAPVGAAAAGVLALAVAGVGLVDAPSGAPADRTPAPRTAGPVRNQPARVATAGAGQAAAPAPAATTAAPVPGPVPVTRGPAATTTTTTTQPASPGDPIGNQDDPGPAPIDPGPTPDPDPDPDPGPTPDPDPPVTIPPLPPTTLPELPPTTLPELPPVTLPAIPGAPLPDLLLPQDTGDLQLSAGVGALMAALDATRTSACAPDDATVVVDEAASCDLLVVVGATRVA